MRVLLFTQHNLFVLYGNESSMSGTPDEEVDYGSCGSTANPPTDSDHKWSTSENEKKQI
jgi:hypothetical protein